MAFVVGTPVQNPEAYSVFEAVGSLVGGLATAGTIIGAFLAYKRTNRDRAIEQLRRDTSRAVILVHILDNLLVEQNFSVAGVEIARRLAHYAPEQSKAGLLKLFADETAQNLVNYCVYEALFHNDTSDRFDETLRELRYLSRGQIDQFPVIYSMIDDAATLIVRSSRRVFSGSSYIDGLRNADLVAALVNDLPDDRSFDAQTVLLGVQIAGIGQLMTRDFVQKVLDECEIVILVLQEYVRSAEHDALEKLIKHRRSHARRLSRRTTGLYTGDIRSGAVILKGLLGAERFQRISQSMDKVDDLYAKLEDGTEHAIASAR